MKLPDSNKPVSGITGAVQFATFEHKVTSISTDSFAGSGLGTKRTREVRVCTSGTCTTAGGWRAS